MKNVTIALDDETHRKARIRAAELGTSLSALVKDYLTGLADAHPPQTQGVRDMQMTFTAQPAVPLPFGHDPLPPGAYGRFADGAPYYTKDGKPRKPGAMRHLPPLPDDWDKWPEDILASFESWPYDDPGYKADDFDWPELPSG